MDALTAYLAPEAVGFVLTLALSLLIGIEREEHGPDHPETHFGGVRTYPMFGVGGFLLVIAFPDTALPFAVGLGALAALLMVTHRAAIREGDPGLTSEAAALLTFTLGGAAGRGLYWVTVAAGVVAVVLLQEKRRLEGLAAWLPKEETQTLTRFLVLTAVILPAVPNQSFTRFELNPFKFWLVVVAVCGVSYASYMLQRWAGRGRGLLLSGVLGGAYSSTVTTVVLARQSRQRGEQTMTSAGAIVAATGVMYVRLWALVSLFAPAIASRLLVPFAILAVAGIGLGVLLTGRAPADTASDDDRPRTNPLEISAALIFAAVFLGVLVVTQLVATRFGDTGVLVMAGIMGAADVDPFILGLTQVAGDGLGFQLAALAIVIAAAANNVMKGIYAIAFGERRTGLAAFTVLTALGVAGVVLHFVL